MDGGHRRDDRRLHICMGEVCNNNCLFCMDKGGRLRQRHLELIDPEETVRFMEENRDLGEVLFTAGEPTLHEDLERYIGHAKRLGFHRIGLITNGRRLAYRAYAERLLRRGLNSVDGPYELYGSFGGLEGPTGPDGPFVPSLFLVSPSLLCQSPATRRHDFVSPLRLTEKNSS